jgi:hypothetical protein
LNLQPADYKSAALPLSYASLARKRPRAPKKSDIFTSISDGIMCELTRMDPGPI